MCSFNDYMVILRQTFNRCRYELEQEKIPFTIICPMLRALMRCIIKKTPTNAFDDMTVIKITFVNSSAFVGL